MRQELPAAVTPEAVTPEEMAAVVLTGHGGFDKLEYRTDVAVPMPAADEVLVHIGAAGVNNTDINTRIGWYSKSVTTASNEAAADTDVAPIDDGMGWDGAVEFPRIQGADAAGVIVAVGAEVDPGRNGQRVLIRSMQYSRTGDPETECDTFGSEMDGGFAQYGVVRANEAFPIDSELSDVELASFPCAYSTAEGVLHRTELAEGETVLITGASGGVGSAAVQLARRRGATVIAAASRAKWADVEPLGADLMVDRSADLVAELGTDSVDVIVDVVGGPAWPALLDILRKRGRYGTCGAIAGPIVELDLRTLYLKDQSLLGSTYQPVEVFANLVGYIERGEIEPVIAGTYPLADIVTAQQDFLDKGFTGKLVLVPPDPPTLAP